MRPSPPLLPRSFESAFGASRARARAALPLGNNEIDRHRRGGGNVAIDGAGAALFAAGIAVRTRGKVLWCITRPDLFAPTLARAGLKSDRVNYLKGGDDKSAFRSLPWPLGEWHLRCLLRTIE